jgi:quercetin dioxygenase-like cupin family protein
LIRIARSLGKRPSFFIEKDELDDVARVPGDQARSWTASQGVTAHVLSPGIPGSELFSYRLVFRGAPAEWKLAAQAAPGDALYFVARGAVEARLGDLAVHLSEGDAIQGAADIPHRLKNAAAETAEVVAVLTRSIEKHQPAGGKS